MVALQTNDLTLSKLNALDKARLGEGEGEGWG